MRALARWSWAPLIGLLLLTVAWLESRTAWQIPWGIVFVSAFVLIFLVRLSKQWQTPVPVEMRWASQPLRAIRAVTSQWSLRFFEFGIFALLAAAILYQVLLPPVVGLADNGDFARLMDQTGIEHPAGGPYNKPFQFIDLHFLMDQPREPEGGYVSSELIFVYAALLLDKIVSADELFDLRVLGALHAAAFLAGLLLVLAATRTLPTPSRWISGLLLLLVFTDVGYVAYLNSFYREPAALIFLTLVVACALLYIRAPRPNLALLLAYFAAAVLFVIAKPQHAPQGLLLAVFGVLLSRRWVRGSYHRWASVGMALVVCLTAVWSLVSQPTPLREANLYNQVFSDLLPHSPAPTADLADLGLDRDLVKWIGTDAYDEDAPINSPTFKEHFFGNVTYGSLLEFYATHPGRFASMLNRAAGEGFSLRPGNLGNFEEASGLPPGTQSHTFDVWSGVRESFPSKSLAGLVAVLGLAALAASRVWKQYDTLQDRMLAELFLLLVAMTAVEFTVACLVGGALDVVKHLFAFNLLADMVVIMAGSYAVKWWTTVVK